MKLLSAATLLLAGPLPISAAAISSFFDPSQAPLQVDVSEETNNVKGANPLLSCTDPASYVLQIDTVDLSPNPPVPYVRLLNPL